MLTMTGWSTAVFGISVSLYTIFLLPGSSNHSFDYTSIISRDLKTSGYSAIDKSLPKRRNKSFFLPSDDSRYSFPMQFVFCVIDESTLRDEYIIITRCSKETNDRSQGRTTSTVKDPEQVRGRFLSLWPRINQTYTKELVKALTPPARLAFVNFSPWTIRSWCDQTHKGSTLVEFCNRYPKIYPYFFLAPVQYDPAVRSNRHEFLNYKKPGIKTTYTNYKHCNGFVDSNLWIVATITYL